MHIILLVGHIIGVALGAGGATMSDILFLLSVRDRRLDRSELKLLKMASAIVLMGLGLLYVTGFGFVMTGSAVSGRFFAKMLIVLVATFNGILMHLFIFPFLESCARHSTDLLSDEVLQYAPYMVSAGAVSAVSWYTALVLGIWRTLSISFWQIISVYGVLVLAGVLAANLLLQLLLRVCHQAHQKSSDAIIKQRLANYL